MHKGPDLVRMRRLCGGGRGSSLDIASYFGDAAIVATRAPLSGYNGPANRGAGMRRWRERLPGAERAHRRTQNSRVW